MCGEPTTYAPTGRIAASTATARAWRSWSRYPFLRTEGAVRLPPARIRTTSTHARCSSGAPTCPAPAMSTLFSAQLEPWQRFSRDSSTPLRLGRSAADARTAATFSAATSTSLPTPRGVRPCGDERLRGPVSQMTNRTAFDAVIEGARRGWQRALDGDGRIDFVLMKRTGKLRPIAAQRVFNDDKLRPRLRPRRLSRYLLNRLETGRQEYQEPYAICRAIPQPQSTDSLGHPLPNATTSPFFICVGADSFRRALGQRTQHQGTAQRSTAATASFDTWSVDTEPRNATWKSHRRLGATYCPSLPGQLRRVTREVCVHRAPGRVRSHRSTSTSFFDGHRGRRPVPALLSISSEHAAQRLAHA